MKPSILTNIFALSLAIFSTASSFTARESGARLAAMAVEIVYTSPGDGIDYQLKAKIDQLIAGEKSQGHIVDYRQKSWGREGELTVCIEFRTYERAYRSEIQLKDLISKSQKKTTVKLILSCDPNRKIPPNA